MKNELRIPIGDENPKDYARKLRKSLTVLQRLALNPVAQPDDFDAGELETMRFVLDLMIELQDIEEKESDP